MGLYPDVSLEKTQRIKLISDEIGRITKKLLVAAESDWPIDSDDEARLKELKKELESLCSPKAMGSRGLNNSGTNQPAL